MFRATWNINLTRVHDDSYSWDNQSPALSLIDHVKAPNEETVRDQTLVNNVRQGTFTSCYTLTANVVVTLVVVVNDEYHRVLRITVLTFRQRSREYPISGAHDQSRPVTWHVQIRETV